MGVYSTGNPYGIPEDLIYSFPVQIKVKLVYLCVTTITLFVFALKTFLN